MAPNDIKRNKDNALQREKNVNCVKLRREEMTLRNKKQGTFLVFILCHPGNRNRLITTWSIDVMRTERSLPCLLEVRNSRARYHGLHLAPV